VIVLKFLFLQVRMQENIIKIGFAGSRDHAVFSTLRTSRVSLPMAARSKAQFFDRSLAEIVG
jgi:hypothetical protein